MTNILVIRDGLYNARQEVKELSRLLKIAYRRLKIQENIHNIKNTEEAQFIRLRQLQQGGSMPSYQGASVAPQIQDIYKTENFPKPQEIKQESPTEETQAATIDLNNLDMDEALIVYRDYIEGIYDGTPDELIAEKVYDKLNRIFYKKAKEQGMSAPNYIKSTIKG